MISKKELLRVFNIIENEMILSKEDSEIANSPMWKLMSHSPEECVINAKFKAIADRNKITKNL